ncbi:hypothetical protein Spb1_41160 [Planctopirus ephydatiae]|uniref:Uncharacterized protein n=1 Tax=Planctopirus ephydatiae TaxID=2528019 RepID=A0A518GUB6_9PLAN|nr:hypothetical protein Spb1_41160 [Planctopirus ephydatiae]
MLRIGLQKPEVCQAAQKILLNQSVALREQCHNFSGVKVVR